jgi:SAM-dependent methyltransferase
MNFTYERDLVSDLFHQRHIVPKIQRDQRSRMERNLLLGYPFHQIRHQIIKNGRIDFDAGYDGRHGHLTPDDLVALYNYIYLSRHHAECRSTFDRFESAISVLFQSNHPTWVVDLGCGSGTAGLAIADHSSGQQFHYLGIDQSCAMRRNARSLLIEARSCGLLDTGCHITTTASTNVIRSSLAKPAPPLNLLFVASYLFASQSLDVLDLARSVQATTLCRSVQNCVLVYLNSATRYANKKYEQFVGCFAGGRRLGIQSAAVRYCRYAGRRIAEAKFVNDCLILKGAQ